MTARPSVSGSRRGQQPEAHGLRPGMEPGPRTEPVQQLTGTVFEFGDWWAGYGTDLFSYDAGLDRLTVTHNHYDDVNAIAFNPRFPTLMYLGLAEVR